MDRRTASIAAVVVIGAIMSILDTTVVNIALDTLGRDLHASLDDVQWVSTGYLLALAIVIPVTGWASERIGARRVWLTSVTLFVLGSVLCARPPRGRHRRLTHRTSEQTPYRGPRRTFGAAGGR